MVYSKDMKKTVTRINKLKIISNHEEVHIIHKTYDKTLSINGVCYNYNLVSKQERKTVFWDDKNKELFEKDGTTVGARIKTRAEEKALTLWCYPNLFLFKSLLLNLKNIYKS